MPKKVNFRGDDPVPAQWAAESRRAGVPRTMSSIIEPQSRSAAVRGGSADVKILAHIEKWMAMIRDISREPILNRDPVKS